jgi:hypothetical protein
MIVALFVSILVWWHGLLAQGLGRATKAWLDGVEQSCLSLWREALSLVQRALNGASAWVVGGACVGTWCCCCVQLT